MASQSLAALALCLSIVSAGVMYALYRRKREAYLLAGIATWVLLASYHGLQLLDFEGRNPAMRAAYGMLMIWAAVSLIGMARLTPGRVFGFGFVGGGVAGSVWSWLYAYQVYPYARLLPPAAIASLLFFYCALLFWEARPPEQ